VNGAGPAAQRVARVLLTGDRRHSAVATRQKSTARRFVSICAVHEDT
jgi:hypothetical protein